MTRIAQVSSKRQFIDMNGKRCRALAVERIDVHEDPELMRRWFYVYVCEKHKVTP